MAITRRSSHVCGTSGLHPTSDLLIAMSGFELVGPLSENLQLVTTFIGGIHAKANAKVPAKALLQFLRTPEAATEMEDKGLEPA